MLLWKDGDAKDEDRWVGGGRRYNEGPGEGEAFSKCGERVNRNVGKVCGDVFGGVAMTNL